MADGATADRIEAIRNVPTLEALYAAGERINITPGWVRREQPILWAAPHSAFVPAHWRYDECKAALDAAGRLIDVALAERRNLVLRNPIEGNDIATTRTLVCAYQMILPGEAAPSHRHAPHALRVILDGAGSYSIVDGEKTPMETGDVVLTPGWCWHSHGHDGDRPAYWLDVPLVRLMETMFYEEHPDRFERNVRTVASSPYRFPRAEIARRLDHAVPDPEGFHGPRITLEAPTMPTMGLGMERLAAGTATRRQRSTANRVFCPVEGSGESIVGGERIAWRRGDTFAVPCWTKFEHRAAADTVLFDLSDEPLMRFAHYWRFEAD
ncbi:MAG TPA: cupin domain-containing protein [Stellaceae bacterium]|nr:cupin domain-containing protein [Stellaceae bacterium]